MKKVAVIGANGYVGKAAVAFFENKFEVLKYDPVLEENATKDEVNCADLAVVCVPTLSRDDGSCDTTIVEETIAWLTTPLILIKSTVTPGTTKKLIEKSGKNIVFSPEFIGEGGYFSNWGFEKEMIKTPFFIFGGDKENIAKLIGEFYAPIAGPTKQYRYTDPTTAELVKYWENTYFALKVTFVNEMYEVAKSFGVDFYEARDLWLLDPRVDGNHTMVFADKRGFGGKCLPKDTNALVAATLAKSYRPELLLKMLEVNAKFNKTEPVRVKVGEVNVADRVVV